MRLLRRVQGPAELRPAIDELTSANRSEPSAARDRELLALRHQEGIRLLDRAPAHPQFADAQPIGAAPGSPPQLAPAELSPSALRGAILEGGCALVRGLVPREAAERFAAEIECAYAVRAGDEAGVPAGAADGEGYYEEFEPDSRFGGVLWRSWIEEGGGLLAADSPRLSFQMFELFASANLRELVGGYLGEPPLISVHKTTLRKAEPAVSGAWHQDGAFMGPVRALNMWLALSRCGDEAPGLDLVPRRLEEFVATGTEGAALDWTVSDAEASSAAGQHGVIRPIFEPGDALFFDELFLHKTASDPAMPKPRFAIESWFFGASMFPADYAPLAV